ncbi:MAG: hypothetical protein WDZ94_04800 [Patescibacteria group bacterium]
MSSLFNHSLTNIFEKDKTYLETTQVPIVTISGTYREDLKKWHGLPNNNTDRDVVLSRAHYSMALGVAMQTWKTVPDPQKAWLVDPTNYVAGRDWLSVNVAERIGMTIARRPILHRIKSWIDRFGRQKNPILSSITPPLLYLFENVRTPILSFHISAGNLLADQGHTVLQMITDPHVRSDYLTHAESKNMHYLVFDESTKFDFLEQSAIQNIQADASRIYVSGPPIDPRIIAAGRTKKAWRSGPINICITTGGLGTNKTEIELICQQIFPLLNKNKYRLIIYAGTHKDIFELIEEKAKQHRLTIQPLTKENAKLRVIYHPQIIDANELLIQHGFPWADGFISKPSGDMAYDAAAAGCFLLTLQEWGEWEHHVRIVFEERDIARKAVLEDIVTQLDVLSSAKGRAQSWMEQAMHSANALDKSFLNGAKQILATHAKLTQS